MVKVNNKALATELPSYFGFMKGYVKINEDIVNCSFAEDWEINNDQQCKLLFNAQARARIK